MSSVSDIREKAERFDRAIDRAVVALRSARDRGIPLEVGARAADLKRLVAEIAAAVGDARATRLAAETGAACDSILPSASTPLRLGRTLGDATMTRLRTRRRV